MAAEYFQLQGLASDDPRRVVIVNGVDEADLPEGVAPPSDRFVLAYVGTLYGIRDPTPALHALSNLIEHGQIDGELVDVRLVGSMWLEGFEAPAGIRIVETGYIEHARAVEEMCSATALLLYVPGSSLAPSGKLFEYLAWAGRFSVLPIRRTSPAGLCSSGTRGWSPIPTTKLRSSRRS